MVLADNLFNIVLRTQPSVLLIYLIYQIKESVLKAFNNVSIIQVVIKKHLLSVRTDYVSKIKINVNKKNTKNLLISLIIIILQLEQ
jgi:hypothetical protein